MRLIDADALKAKIRKAEKEFRRCKIEPFEEKWLLLMALALLPI